MDTGKILHARKRGMDARTIARPALVVIALIAAMVLLGGIKSVSSDESCLYARSGKIQESWGAGFHWRFTPYSSLACYRTSRTTYEASPGKSGGGAQFNDDPVEARTSDGEQIDGVSFRLSFSIPRQMPGADPSQFSDPNLRRIYTDLGARSNADVVSSVITFYARPAIRRLMQIHTSSELYHGDPAVFSQELADGLRPVFASHGVVLEDVLISKPDFNDAFEQRVQDKLAAEAAVNIEQQRGLQADQQNETRIRSASADATVVAVNQGAAGEQSVDQANVNATVVSIEAQAEGERTVTQANAEATAVAAQISAYGGADAYLEAQKIESMRDWPVQVLGESNTVPVLELSPVPTLEAE
jgi:regulator of protease activity HflC (stomatin/prohibitin superfamily)